MKKRLLSILLVVAMLLSMVPTAFAAEAGETFTPVAVELVNAVDGFFADMQEAS